MSVCAHVMYIYDKKMEIERRINQIEEKVPRNIINREEEKALTFWEKVDV